MATSGSIDNKAYISGDGHTWHAVLNWERTSYDVDKCTTTINWSLSIYREGGVNGTWIYEYGSSVSINNESVHSNSSHIRRQPNSGSTVIASGTKTVSNNSDGSGSFSISFDVKLYSDSNVISGSQSFELEKIPRYANFTEHYISATLLNSISVYWNADASIDAVQYSLNGGAWVNTSGLNYTINGLSPNTNYTIKTRIKRTDSQLWTESSTISGTTKDIARISSVSNFNHGDSIIVAVTNPARSTIKFGNENWKYANINKKCDNGE